MSTLKSSKQPTSEAATVAPALKELLERFIDYAGIFPPAKLDLEPALQKFSAYKDSEYGWMLRSFVVPAAQLDLVPRSFDKELSVLSGDTLPAYEIQARAASIETTGPVGMNAGKRIVFCQVPPDRPELLDEVKLSHCFAKIRTGGLQPQDIPSAATVAEFIADCAQRSLPFKATAGLHHPIRATYALTYEADAPRAVMHGFINMLMASAFAFHGDRDLEPILAETDPNAFQFSQQAKWRDRVLTDRQIKEARQKFVFSVGSCSFEEPVQDLQALGLLK